MCFIIFVSYCSNFVFDAQFIKSLHSTHVLFLSFSLSAQTSLSFSYPLAHFYNKRLDYIAILDRLETKLMFRLGTVLRVLHVPLLRQSKGTFRSIDSPQAWPMLHMCLIHHLLLSRCLGPTNTFPAHQHPGGDIPFHNPTRAPALPCCLASLAFV